MLKAKSSVMTSTSMQQVELMHVFWKKGIDASEHNLFRMFSFKSVYAKKQTAQLSRIRVKVLPFAARCKATRHYHFLGVVRSTLTLQRSSNL